MGNVGYHFLCAFLLRSGLLLQQLDMMSDRFKLKFQSFLPDRIFCVRHCLKVIFPKCNQDLLQLLQSFPAFFRLSFLPVKQER